MWRERQRQRNHLRFLVAPLDRAFGLCAVLIFAHDDRLLRTDCLGEGMAGVLLLSLDWDAEKTLITALRCQNDAHLSRPLSLSLDSVPRCWFLQQCGKFNEYVK